MHMPANGIFSGHIANLLSILRVLIKILSHAIAKKKKKEKKRPNDLNFCTFIGPFSNDIMAVKGLMLTFHLMAHPPEEQNYSFFIKNTYFFFLFN